MSNSNIAVRVATASDVDRILDWGNELAVKQIMLPSSPSPGPGDLKPPHQAGILTGIPESRLPQRSSADTPHQPPKTSDQTFDWHGR